MAGRTTVVRDQVRLRKSGISSEPGLPAATAKAAQGLPGQLMSEANETILLHGTSPGVLLSILSTGPNERFSGSNAGTIFGDGTYLAEDAGKNDQYCTSDDHYDASSELHKRLYAHQKHPGKVFYILVCRVALGQHVRTKQTGRAATSVRDGSKIFPISFRELSPVSEKVQPPVYHHSLLADGVFRYREFVVFHSNYILSLIHI